MGETLFAEDARAIGQAFGTVVKSCGGDRVAVGYDGRLTSPELENALCLGLAASGIDVIRIGRGPSPMLYFAVHHLDVHGGIMVTGSHNPPEFNGFKMMLGKAGFFGRDIGHLAEIAAKGAFTGATEASGKSPSSTPIGTACWWKRRRQGDESRLGFRQRGSRYRSGLVPGLPVISHHQWRYRHRPPITV